MYLYAMETFPKRKWNSDIYLPKVREEQISTESDSSPCTLLDNTQTVKIPHGSSQGNLEAEHLDESANT